jgi:hypothetical protein
VTRYHLTTLIKAGIYITSAGTLWLLIAAANHASPLFSLFLPMIILYFGLSLIMPSASTIGMNQAHDKAHASAVMNFINMGATTIAGLSLAFFTLTPLLMPLVFLFFCVVLFGLYQWMLVRGKFV